MSVSADPGSAAGEIIGAVLEQLDGSRPDLAVLFVASSHVQHSDDFVATVKATVRPTVLLAASAVGVLGGGREAEQGPGVSLWAGMTGPVEALRMEAFDRSTMLGVPPELRSGDTLLVLADPESFPLYHLFDELPGGVGVVGGLASAVESGGNRLWLGSKGFADGAVGAVIPAGVATAIVSQGCRPVGPQWTVTRSSRGLVHELAGQPAVERLDELIDSLSAEDRAAASRGLYLGIVVDPHDAGDSTHQGVLIRDVLGVQRSTQSMAVGDLIEIGTVVQFQVRDAESASADLLETLHTGERYRGALAFAGSERGQLFAEPNHDAGWIAEATEGGVAGMFCVGELGPIGGRNAVHRSSVTVLAFRQLP